MFVCVSLCVSLCVCVYVSVSHVSKYIYIYMCVRVLCVCVCMCVVCVCKREISHVKNVCARICLYHQIQVECPPFPHIDIFKM